MRHWCTAALLLGFLLRTAAAAEAPPDPTEADRAKAAHDLATTLLARMLDTAPESLELAPPYKAPWPGYWDGRGRWPQPDGKAVVEVWYTIDATRKYVSTAAFGWPRDDAKPADSTLVKAHAASMVRRARTGLPDIALDPQAQVPGQPPTLWWFGREGQAYTGEEVLVTMEQQGVRPSLYIEYRPPRPPLKPTVTEAEARAAALKAVGAEPNSEHRVISAALFLGSRYAPKEGPVWEIRLNSAMVYIDARTVKQLRTRLPEFDGPAPEE